MYDIKSLYRAATLLSLGVAHLAAAVEITELYQFPNGTFIENGALRPNGHLLLSSLSFGNLLDFDPSAKSPVPQMLGELPGATGASGIAAIAPDTFAVSGGHINQSAFKFVKGTMRMYTITFPQPDAQPAIKIVAELPDTEMLNGMAALPGCPGVVLSVDSGLGRIFRINTLTGAADVVFQDDLLGPGSDPSRVPLGANGIKIHGGHLYFANSARGTFGRVQISPEGEKLGDIEYFSDVDIAPDAPSHAAADDDFALDTSGVAYVARHPNMLVKISPSWQQEILVGDGSTIELQEPTSVVLGDSGRAVYVVTAGLAATGHGTTGGQVVRVVL